MIDDGTLVKKGQKLIELDDSSLQEQNRTQAIAVEKAKGEWIKADERLIIAVKMNESDIADSQAEMAVAELDLDKFLGIRADPELDPLGSLAGGGSTLVERGEYRKQLRGLDSQLKLAAVRPGGVPRPGRLGRAVGEVRLPDGQPGQGRAVQARPRAGHGGETPEGDVHPRDVHAGAGADQPVGRCRTSPGSTWRRAYKQADAKMDQAESTRRTAYSVYQQELEKLREIEEQIERVPGRRPAGRDGGLLQGVVEPVQSATTRG